MPSGPGFFISLKLIEGDCANQQAKMLWFYHIPVQLFLCRLHGPQESVDHTNNHVKTALDGALVQLPLDFQIFLHADLEMPGNGLHQPVSLPGGIRMVLGDQHSGGNGSSGRRDSHGMGGKEGRVPGPWHTAGHGREPGTARPGGRVVGNLASQPP